MHSTNTHTYTRLPSRESLLESSAEQISVPGIPDKQEEAEVEEEEEEEEVEEDEVEDEGKAEVKEEEEEEVVVEKEEEAKELGISSDCRLCFSAAACELPGINPDDNPEKDARV